MPLYDFACRACGSRFEALVRSFDPPPVCKGCGGADLERLPSAFAATSREKLQAAATRARRKAAAAAHRDNAAIERELEEHRREDH